MGLRKYDKQKDSRRMEVSQTRTLGKLMRLSGNLKNKVNSSFPADDSYEEMCISVGREQCMTSMSFGIRLSLTISVYHVNLTIPLYQP